MQMKKKEVKEASLKRLHTFWKMSYFTVETVKRSWLPGVGKGSEMNRWSTEDL